MNFNTVSNQIRSFFNTNNNNVPGNSAQKKAIPTAGPLSEIFRKAEYDNFGETLKADVNQLNLTTKELARQCIGLIDGYSEIAGRMLKEFPELRGEFVSFLVDFDAEKDIPENYDTVKGALRESGCDKDLLDNVDSLHHNKATDFDKMNFMLKHNDMSALKAWSDSHTTEMEQQLPEFCKNYPEPVKALLKAFPDSASYIVLSPNKNPPELISTAVEAFLEGGNVFPKSRDVPEVGKAAIEKYRTQSLMKMFESEKFNDLVKDDSFFASSGFFPMDRKFKKDLVEACNPLVEAHPGKVKELLFARGAFQDVRINEGKVSELFAPDIQAYAEIERAAADVLLRRIFADKNYLMGDDLPQIFSRLSDEYASAFFTPFFKACINNAPENPQLANSLLDLYPQVLKHVQERDPGLLIEMKKAMGQSLDKFERAVAAATQEKGQKIKAGGNEETKGNEESKDNELLAREIDLIDGFSSLNKKMGDLQRAKENFDYERKLTSKLAKIGREDPIVHEPLHKLPTNKGGRGFK